MIFNGSNFAGLVTSVGIGLVTPGSFQALNNWQSIWPGILLKRPGLARQPGVSGGAIWSMFSSRALGAQVLVHIGTGGNGTGLRRGTGAAALTAITTIDGGNITCGINPRMHMALAGTSHYLTSQDSNGGVRRLESGFGAVRYAGMPRGRAPDTYNMDAAVYAVLGGAGGFLPNGSNVAYRVTWHRKDPSGAELSGPPTGRLVVRNIAGTSGFAAAANNVTLRIPLPVEFGTTATALTTSYYWRLWRSPTASADTARDEMYLVAEQFLAAGDIAAGYATVTDSTPDSFLGQIKLNTNATDFPVLEAGLNQGILNADDPPPMANDVALFQNCLWFLNIQRRPAVSVQLLLVGGAGIVAGSTVTVDGTVFTGVAGAPVGNQFTVVVGLATLALNIEATSRNIVEAINRSITTSYAYYVSLGTQRPGLIYIEARQWASPSFSSSVGTAWSPNAATGITDTSTPGINRLAFSKSGKFDAVPVLNEFAVGSADARGLRLMPLRERLLVFSDDGIFQVTGTNYADFTLTPFDLSKHLAAPEAIAVVDDECYAWCREGIVRINDAGVKTISSPRIEGSLSSIVAIGGLQNLEDTAFAIGYRQAHRVLFFYDTDVAGPDLYKWFEYDTKRDVWSSGDTPYSGVGFSRDGKSCGCVVWSSDLLMLGNWNSGGTDAYLYLETPGVYVDVARDGLTRSISSTATWNYFMPSASDRQHWQQTVLMFLPSAKPTSIQAGWRVVNTSQSSSPLSTISSPPPLMRLETPSGYRRATRVAFSLVHSAQESCGIEAMEMRFAGGSIGSGVT